MNHRLDFPGDYDECASEVESKGWFGEARLRLLGKQYRLNFYDPERLRQEIASELQRGNFYFEPNLVVVPSLTRQNMEHAVRLLIESGTVSSLIAE